MAQIREIKKRIKSIESTRKVTHAMELVAAAKMRKSQLLALSARPYTNALHEILSNVQSASHRAKHKLLLKNPGEKKLTIIVSSDRGLAGGLNINIFREILKSTSSTIRIDQLITVGKKARDFVAKNQGELIASFDSDEKPPLDLARTLTKMVISTYTAKEVAKVSLIYPHFTSTIKQEPKWIQLLPIPPQEETKVLSSQISSQNVDPLFEPSADKILEFILSHHVLTQIYQVLIETKASEHSARMVAMKNATEAAGDLVDDLTLTYNQARQEAITKELLDITTAQKAFA